MHLFWIFTNGNKHFALFNILIYEIYLNILLLKGWKLENNMLLLAYLSKIYFIKTKYFKNIFLNELIWCAILESTVF